MHFNHILVTTDLSDASRVSFDLAAYEQKMEGSRLTLLSVVSDWEVPLSMYPYIPAPERIEEFRKQIVAHARKRVDGYISTFHGQTVNPEVVLSNRPVADEITDYARKNACDLIIMASHGRGAIGEFFLGGTVQKVLRMAPCPVMVVPPSK